MTSAGPPRLATWLLQRFATDSGRESLVGDLVERYRNGRSSAWYWRQALAAILLGAGSDLWSHKLSAARALAIGWTLYVLFSFPANSLSRLTRVLVATWLAESGHYSYWSVFWSGQLPGTLFAYLACFASGWIVGRLHQRLSAAMVCLYAVSVLLFEYGMVVLMLSRFGHPPMSQAALIIPAVLVIGRPLSIVAGGLWSIRRERGSIDRTLPSRV